MVHVADVELASGARALHLRMAAEAQVGVTDGQQLGVDRAVGIVASGAAFPQRGVIEYEGPGLFPVAPGAGLVRAGHGRAAGRFHNVQAVRIVALDAIHLAFGDRVVLGKMEFGVDVQMALETGLRVLARIDDIPFGSRAACRHVLARRAVAGLAPVLARHLAGLEVQPGVRAGRENAGDPGVAIQAYFVAHKGCAFDRRGLDHRAVGGGTGINQQYERANTGARRQSRRKAPDLRVKQAHETRHLRVGALRQKAFGPWPS